MRRGTKAKAAPAGADGVAAAPDRVDVLIAGGGHVGLSLALALREAEPGLAVTVVDATPPEAIEP